MPAFPQRVSRNMVRAGVFALGYLHLLFVAYLGFLFPVAVYCVVLGLINRRRQPTMVSGTWDTIGLLLGCSGFLFITVPTIIVTFYLRNVEHPFVDEAHPMEPLERIWVRWWLVWLGYFCMVLGGAVLLVWMRQSATVIYNVDPDLFEGVVGRAVEKLGLAQTRVGRRVFIGPMHLMPESTTAIASSPLTASRIDYEAELEISPFEAMSNLTLRWRHGSPALRSELEAELRRNLDDCRALDNPAGRWLMGLGTILLGLVFLVIVLIMLLLYLPPRR